MNKKQKTLALYIVSLVGIINALSYALIIPFLYPYAKLYGISAVGSGLLFAAFAAAQFIATPIIGRLSDIYGRKYLLAGSVFGTAVSQILMAVAWSAPVLYVARILDGITGGNNSVAQAIISDTVEPKERAKWFGILGASFGLGFLVGPAIGGLLSSYSIRLPFYVAGGIALFATILMVFFLSETLPIEAREAKNKPLFDFKNLISALSEPFVGSLFLITFFVNFAFSVFILGFQTFTTDVLRLSTTMIALQFTLFGFIGLIMQGYVVGKVVKKFPEIPLMFFGISTTAIGFLCMGLSNSIVPFMLSSIIVAFGNSFVVPISIALLSKHTSVEDQGGVMGINQSYMSLGSIIGPVVGGLLTTIGPNVAFFGASVSLLLALYYSYRISRISGKHIVDL